jgi:hypothetical protein
MMSEIFMLRLEAFLRVSNVESGEADKANRVRHTETAGRGIDVARGEAQTGPDQSTMVGVPVSPPSAPCMGF